MKSREESADTIKQSLQLIPGVGPKLAQKFHDIGIKRISDLKGKEPEELYSQIDISLMQLLGENASQSGDILAKKLKVSAATVRRRIRKLNLRPSRTITLRLPNGLTTV